MVRRHLSEPEVARLVTLIEEGYTRRAVGDRMGVSQSVVSRLYARYLETAGYNRRPGQGRHRVTTRRDDRAIIRHVQREPFVHANIVAQNFPNRRQQQQQQRGRRQRVRNISAQTDNAPSHRAVMTRRFFERHDITLLQHPPMSPDLNPIEHVWDIMGRRLRREYPNLLNLAALERALQQIWNTIPQPEIARRINMAERLRAVIESRGGNTRY